MDVIGLLMYLFFMLLMVSVGVLAVFGLWILDQIKERPKTMFDDMFKDKND